MSYAQSLHEHRLRFCETCEHFDPTYRRCQLLHDRGMPGRVDHVRALPASTTACPDGQFGAIQTTRVELPPLVADDLSDFANTAVITAADQGFAVGAYLLWWTWTQANTGVPFIVYDLGLDPATPCIAEMITAGVEFRSVKSSRPKVRGWQTWQKPDYIRDALGSFERVAWIDADCTIAGSVRQILDYDGLFIPDHGSVVPLFNANTPLFCETFGEPSRVYPYDNAMQRTFPCAGIIGVDCSNMELVEEWISRIDRCFQSQQLLRDCRYYDQNCLQDLVSVELQPGDVWSNFQGIRSGDPAAVIAQTYSDSNVVVWHFGGPKPWRDWWDFGGLDAQTSLQVRRMSSGHGQ